MALLGTLGVKLTAATAQFEKGMKRAAGSVKDATAQIEKLTLAATVGFAAGSLVVLKFVNAASDAAEAANVLGIAFGDSAGLVADWAKETSKTVGRSVEDIKGWAGEIGLLLQPTLGVSDATREMSQNLTQLAIDLGSVANVSDERALLALRAAMIGSAEPMMSLGVVMSVAALDAFALSRGLTKVTKDMTEAEKQTLRYNFLIEKASFAQGDAAKTAGGWANMTKRIAGQIKDLTVELGGGLLPIAEDLAASVSDLLSWFQGLSTETKQFVGISVAVATGFLGIAAAVGAAALAFTMLSAAVVVPVAVVVASIVLIGLAVANIIAVFAVVRKAWDEDLWGMSTAVSDALGYMAGKWEEFNNNLARDWDELTGYIADAWSWLTGVMGKQWEIVTNFWVKEFKGAVNSIFGFINNVIAELKFMGWITAETAEQWRVDYDNAGEWVAKTFEDVKNAAGEMAQKIAVFSGETATGIEDSLGGAASFVSDAWGEMADDILEALGLVGEEAEKLKKKLAGGIGVGVGAGAGAGAGDPSDAILIDPYAKRELIDPYGDEPPAGLTGATEGLDQISQFGEIAAGFATELGEFGGTLQKGMQAFEGGGPWAAVFAVLLDLASKTEGFQEIIASLDKVVGAAIDAIEPLVQAFAPLIETIASALVPIIEQVADIILAVVEGGFGLFLEAIGSLIQAILPVVSILLTVLTPIMKVIGFVFRVFAIVVGAVAVAIGWVVNAVIDIVTAILDVVAGIADIFGAGGKIREFSNSLKSSRVDVDALTDGLKAAATGTYELASAATDGSGIVLTALQSLRRGLLQAAIMAATVNVDPELMIRLMAEQFQAIADIQRDAASVAVPPLNELAEASTDAASSFREATASLSNVPRGFKIAAARFAAIATGPSATAASPAMAAAGDAGRLFQIGNIYVTANDPMELMRQIESEAEWQNFAADGTPIPTPPDPGKR